MDILAHTLIGIGVAKCGLSRRFGAGTTVALAVSSNLPDIDVLWTCWNPWDRFMLRRTQTHALVALPVLAACLAWGLRRRYPGQRWSILFGLSALGIGLHLLFDLVNSFGVVILWPLSSARYELASIFIIDLCVWGLTLAPLLVSLRLCTERAKERAFRLSVAALGAYVVLCVAAHARTEAIVRRELRRSGPEPPALRIFPEPLGPQRFRAAARAGPAWNVYLCSLLRGTAELRAVVPTDDDAPRVLEVRRSPYGRKIEWFMAAPVWTALPDGTVEVYDLRFANQVVARTPIFQVEFPPGRLTPRVR